MKFTETACVSDELCRLVKEEVGQIVSLGDKACTGPYSFLKHANSESSGPGVQPAT